MKNRSSVPLALTTYDVLKTFAVITMIIDHFGYYFFPENLWLRAIGRLSFPVWLFLIGYARSRTIKSPLVLGALLIVAADAVLGRLLLPINILLTIIIARLCLDHLMRFTGPSERRLYGISIVLALLVPVTDAFSEYGTLAIIFAMLGYLIRHGWLQHKKPAAYSYGIFCLGLYLGFEQYWFGFPPEIILFITLGTAGVLATLYYYLPQKEPGIHFSNKGVQKIVSVFGHYTLEIYILHLLLFKIVYFGLHGCMTSLCIWH